jgi:A/G-specific adenine glycosylase
MLQQTQVAVVIPYFERWMDRFPTVKALAEARQEEVMKLWEGLGYYSRARNLHEGARYVVERHNGILPNTSEELSKIKGLGDYTVGAILTFAFRQKVPAVDGNVIRVLARYYGIDDDIAKAKTVKAIRSMTSELLPDAEPWLVSEGLIELGATVCQKKPKCSACPLKASCKALATGKTLQLPYKSTKTKIESLHRAVAVVTCKEHILIRQAPAGEIMAGLYEFPYMEAAEGGLDGAAMESEFRNRTGIDSQWIEDFGPVSHSFTRYRVKLYPALMRSSRKQDVPGHVWLPLHEAAELPFSSGHRRVLAQLLETRADS